MWEAAGYYGKKEVAGCWKMAVTTGISEDGPEFV